MAVYFLGRIVPKHDLNPRILNQKKNHTSSRCGVAVPRFWDDRESERRVRRAAKSSARSASACSAFSSWTTTARTYRRSPIRAFKRFDLVRSCKRFHLCSKPNNEWTKPTSGWSWRCICCTPDSDGARPNNGCSLAMTALGLCGDGSSWECDRLKSS